MNIPSFLLPANGVQTPESIARRRQMAQAMMGQGMDASPIASPWQGAARMAQALVGGLQMRRADQQDAAGRQSATDALVKALNGGDANTVAALNNPFMSGPGTQMVGDAYQRAHQPAAPPQLKDLGNGQFYQFDPNNPQGGQTFTPPGYVAPAPAEPPPTSDMREYAAAKAQGFPGSLQDWLTAIKGASATQVNVNGGGSDKQVFDAMDAKATAAKAAATGLKAMQEAEAAVTSGAVTGFGANQRLDAYKLGALLGIADPAVIENTETFRAAMAPQVSAMLKATVGTTQISNTDRQFAERAAGGDITLDQASIKRLLGIMTKAAKASLADYQNTLDTVYPPNGPNSRERALFSIPGAGAPAAGGAVAPGDMGSDELMKSLGF